MRRKILFFDHIAILSGGERSLLEILKAFPWEEYQPILACPQHGALTQEAMKLGTRIEIIPMDQAVLDRRRDSINLFSLTWDLPKLLSIILRLRRFLATERPSLLVTNSQKAHLIGAFASFLTVTPLCWYFRDILPAKLRRLILPCGLIPKRIIAISQAVARQFTIAGRRWAKVVVVPNAVNLGGAPRFPSKEQILRELRLPPKSRIVGTVGQIARWKGQRHFIEAARELSGRLSGVYFLIVGDVLFEETDYKKQLLQLVEDMALQDRVIFTGYREDPLSLMHAFDLLVHPAVEPEPFGRVLIEAMALGKPIVASNTGAAPEIVQDGKTGILVSPGDSHALAEAVEHLLENPEAAQEMGERGRGRAERLFSTDRLIQDLRTVFASVSIPS